MSNTLDSIGGLSGILLIIFFIFLFAFIWHLLTRKQNSTISDVVAHLIQINQHQQEQMRSLIDKLYESQRYTQTTLIEILRTQQTLLQATTGIDPEILELLASLSEEDIKQLVEAIKEK